MEKFAPLAKILHCRRQWLTNFTYVPKTAPLNFLNCDINILFSEYPDCPPFISPCTGYLVLADHQGHLDCASRASLTVMRITVKNGNPPGTGKIWENRFFTGKMDHHGAKCTQIGAQTCQGTSRTCQNFFTFTFKAAGVTFLKVILHLLQKVLNRR